MACAFLELGEPMLERDLPRAGSDHPSVDWKPDVKPVFV